MADTSNLESLEKIQASDKPVSDDFEYAYAETVNKAFVRITKERLKEILGANRYTNEEIDQKISTIPKFTTKVVSSLPTTDISETTIYLVSSGDDSENLYTEYININGLWEILGTQKSTFSGSAKDVTYDDTETNLGATNVQDAIGKLSDTVNDKVTNPTTGEVEQILAVATVDGNGKPTSYKAVDKPISSGGTPTPVSLVSEMTDTTKTYLYTGTEEGYTSGNWYYYNGSAWVSGGKYGSASGVGWTPSQITLFETIGEYLVFKDATTGQAMFNNLIASLRNSSSGSDEPDTPVNPDKPDVPDTPTTHTITTSLVGCTLNNNATSIEDGGSYTANVTFNYDTYNIDSLTITMGGVNITDSAYSDGVINIAEVTGNVVIAIMVSEIVTLLYKLPQPTTFDGSTILDTECKPFINGTSDITIVGTFTNTQTTTEKAFMYSLLNGNDNALLGVWTDWQKKWMFMTYGYAGNTHYMSFDGVNNKFVVTQTKGQRGSIAHYILNGEYLTNSVSANGGQEQTENPIILGGQRKKDGTVDQYFTGTISDFKVYNRILSETEIKAYLGVN